MKIIVWKVLFYWLCATSLMAQSLKGDLGDWLVKRHSMGIIATNFTESSAAIANALVQARDGNIQNFTNCFLLSTNDSNRLVTDFFYELQQSLTYYQYLLLHEAELQKGESNAISAVSIVPVGLRTVAPGFVNVSNLNTLVIFAEKVGTNWMLCGKTLDQALERTLREMAAPYLYKPNDYSEASVKAAKREAVTRMLADMRSRNVPRDTYLQAVDAVHFGEHAKGTNLWDRWQNAYHSHIFEPPLEYDLTEETTANFTSPYQSLQSVWRALYNGDAQTLLSNSDASAQTWLKSAVGVDVAAPKRNYMIVTNLTKMLVLMAATNTVDGQEYVLFFSRQQAGINPKEGRLAFVVDIFRHERSKYVYTRELIYTRFAAPEAAAEAQSENLSKYAKFHEVMSRSKFPRHFYTIE